MEIDPGQRGAHDWSDYNITFTSTGKTEQVTFFSYILGYSRRQYIEVMEDKKQQTLFRPLTITPGRPQENLKVERPFSYLERSFLNGREFRDMDDLKGQLQKWLAEVNDVRIHGTTKKRPIDMYIEEHPFLQVLPANHFDTSQMVHLMVYSPAGEQLVTHPLAEPGRRERYVGVRQKTGRKPDLVIADVISRLEAFAPEMS